MTETTDSSSFYGRSSSPEVKALYEHIPLQDSTEAFIHGPYNSENLWRDPRRLAFLLARYKFVSRMLEGCGSVLEVGCQEGFGSLLVAKTVGQLVAVDFYRPHIEHCLTHLAPRCPNITFKGHDMLDGPVPGGFDGAYTLDVLEHIEPTEEHRFMRNLALSLKSKGTCIIGIPSLEFQPYASEGSRVGHINCKSGVDFKDFCLGYFDHVYLFAMNDEIVHTGFLPMACYLIALCAGPRPAPPC